MIPFTPSFLVVAARVLASATPVEVLRLARGDGARRWNAGASLAWVQRAGYWSHLREEACRSWWPLLEERTLDEVASIARAQGVLAGEPAPGALALVAWPAHESPGTRYAQCGVVLAAERTRGRALPGDRCFDLQVAWGIVGADGQTWGVQARHRFHAARGDRFVHWWNLPDARVRQGTAA